MPDKYGFITDAERREELRRQQESASRTVELRIRRFNEIDPAVRDILAHFGNAIRGQGTLEVAADPADARWSVRPISEDDTAPPVLDLHLSAMADGSEFLGVWDLGVDDPGNLQTLVEVLRQTTNLEVRRLG